MKITVVGGEARFATQSYMANLMAENEVVAHYDLKTVVKEIPSDTEVVILLTDCTSTFNTNHLSDAAAHVGARIVKVSRRWAKAEAILRAEGIIAPVGDQRQPTADRKRKLAVEYIKEQRRQGRDHPGQDEVENILRKNLGPKTKVSRSELGRWYHDARTVSVTPTVSNDDIRSGARAVLEERPEYVAPKMYDFLVDTVKELTALKGPFLWPDNLWTLVTQEAVALRAAWKNNVQARRAAALVWVKRRWRDYANGGDVPSSGMIKTEGVALFGKHIHHSIVREARVAVLGPWALEVKPASQLQGYQETVVAMSGLDLKGTLITLCESGKIQAYKAARRWWTSKTAITNYILEQPDEDAELESTPQLVREAAAEAAPEADITAPEAEAVDPDELIPMPSLDLNEAFEAAIGEIIETKLLDLSASMAEIIGSQVAAQQSGNFDDLKSDISDALRSTLGGLNTALGQVLSSKFQKHAEDMARIHTEHGSKVIGSVSAAAAQVSSTSTDIRTWLGNVSRMVKAVDPDDLSPDVLMMAVDGRLKAIEAAIKAQAKKATKAAPAALTSTQAVTRLTAIEAALSAVLNGQADLMDATTTRHDNVATAAGGAAPQTASIADLVNMEAVLGLANVATKADLASLKTSVQALTTTVANSSGVAPQTGGGGGSANASIADLVKMATALGLKVSFEPL